MCFKKKLEDIVKECEEIFENFIDITLCFTGHRSQKLPWGFNELDERCLEMKKELREKLIMAINRGYIYFISGMAIGFDTICAEMVLELKKEFPQIKLVCALPCKNQDIKWQPNDRKRYSKILKQADIVRYVSQEYTDKCMLERNEYMLKNSSMVIALYNEKLGGGTRFTVNKAKKLGKELIIINP